MDAGIDGEALRLAPPLQFTIRPGAVRIRLPALTGAPVSADQTTGPQRQRPPS